MPLHPLQVVRAACILSHPIPNTNNVPSAQIILPQKQAGPVPHLDACSVSAACVEGAREL